MRGFVLEACRQLDHMMIFCMIICSKVMFQSISIEVFSRLH